MMMNMMMKRISRALLAGAMLLAVAQPARATVVFSDNFDTETLGLNATPSQWTVTNGTVDIIGGPPDFFNLLPGNGFYIDLDGSTSNAGVMTSIALTLMPGVDYTLQFDLAGSRRANSGINTVRAGVDFNADSFFDVFVDITLPQTAIFTTFFLPFDVASPTSNGRIVFDHSGGDNAGLLLDRVILSAISPPGGGGAVPAPGTLALLGLGLAGLGLSRRRKA